MIRATRLGLRFPALWNGYNHGQSSGTLSSSFSNKKNYNGLVRRVRWNSNKPPERRDIRQDKAERAAQLHSELESLLQNQKKRIQEEKEQPFGSSAARFLRKNRSEMINVAASFVCVLLAFQLATLRRATKQLQQQVQDKENEIQEKQTLLQSLTEPSFVQTLSEKCTKALQSFNESAPTSSNNNNGGGLLFWSRQKETAAAASRVETAAVVQVLQQELERRIGDAGLTDEQKKQRRVQQLKAEEVLVLQQVVVNDTLVEKEPVEIVQDPSGSRVVAKQRVFSI